MTDFIIRQYNEDIQSYKNKKPFVRTRLPERPVIYNDHIRNPDELPQLVKDCKLHQFCITEDDISFLTELYNRKEQAKLWHAGGWLVPSEILLSIFLDFCRHFGIKSFYSISILP